MYTKSCREKIKVVVLNGLRKTTVQKLFHIDEKKVFKFFVKVFEDYEEIAENTLRRSKK